MVEFVAFVCCDLVVGLVAFVCWNLAVWLFSFACGLKLTLFRFALIPKRNNADAVDCTSIVVSFSLFHRYIFIHNIYLNVIFVK